MKLQFSDIRLSIQWIEDVEMLGEMIETPFYTKDTLTFENDYTKDNLWTLVNILNSTLDQLENSTIRVTTDGKCLISLLRG